MPPVSIEAGEDYFANPEKQPRPFVRFQYRAAEIRNQAGVAEFNDVAWALICPAGGKDVIEKPVATWLADLKAHADAGRIPPYWPREYKQAFEAWKEGQEIPVNGHPIKLWTALTPGQRETILGVNILTVEDLALANDEAVGRMGMGGNNLRTMAQAWMKDKNGPGALAAQLDAALEGRKNAEDRLKVLEEQVAELKRQLPATAPVVKPTGPVKIAEPT